MSESTKSRAPRNRTITLSDEEAHVYKLRLTQLHSPATLVEVQDKTIRQDMLHALRHFPANSVDLLFADPPYNLSKTFHERRFQETSLAEYEEWLDS